MKIGYQGIPGSYSEQAIIEFLGEIHELFPIKDFDNVFHKITDNTVDMALIPIENSIGGSLHTNYDLLIKNNFYITGEYSLPINHCLICNPEHDMDDIKFITSHPQALVQCTNFSESNNLKTQEFFDTAGAVKFIKENKTKNVAAIASKSAAQIYDMKILKENIQDKNINYTRFILLSKKKKVNILDKFIQNKISIAFCLKDDPGALASALTLFSSKSINISKIESRPNKIEGTDALPYQYLFYLDINGNIINKECQHAIEQLKNKSIYFRILGNYASLNPHDKPNKKLIIGIIGFGRFGQFLGKNLKKQHYVIATSRNDYSMQAKKLDIKFIPNLNNFINEKMDVVIFSMSILSFRNIIESLPINFFNDKLLVDVLSVKNFPKKIMSDLNIKGDILCTHPMFGPDSANTKWDDLPFVYEKVKIQNNKRCNLFINFFRNMGCKLIEMSCEDHDNYAANSQFITHLTGRILEKVNIKSTPINTKGFNYLLEIMSNTCNDSFELFKGLYENNTHSIFTLDSFKVAIDSTISELNDIYAKKSFRKSLKLLTNNDITQYFDNIKINVNSSREFIDFTIGEPDYQPIKKVREEMIRVCAEDNLSYTNVGGTDKLRKTISIYLKDRKKLDYTKEEILCSNGCKQSIFQVLFYLCNEGDEVILPVPCWSGYKNAIKLVGGIPIIIETYSDNNYQIDLVELSNAITKKTKAIILCNPHNPTGTLMNKENMIGLAKIIEEKNIFVLSDEIYELIDFYKGHISFASLNNMKKYTFTFNGISKGFGLPGLRIGYTAAPEHHIKKLKKIQSHITTCADIIAQSATITALENYIEYQPIIERIEKVSNYLYNKIIKLPHIKCAYPLAGLYIFPNISYYFNKVINDNKIMNSTDFCTFLLSEYNIGVSPGDIFDAPRHIRISFGTDMNKAVELINRLNTIFINENNILPVESF